MISTRKLAELAGVSQSTISRCLNDSHEISFETKERIRTLAREQGYIIKKKPAKTVCSSSRKVIGVLVMRHGFFEDLFLNQVLYELYSIIENENYYPMPLLDFYGVNGTERLHDLLSLGIFEGLIIINRKYDEVIAQYLNSISLPHVYLIYHLRKTAKQSHIIDTDNFAGGYLATKHLIDLGHRKIATITSPLDEYSDRTEGYKAALDEADIKYDSELVFSAGVNYQSYYDITRLKTDVFQETTALFSQFDIGALGAINALGEAGYRVPEDISVIGFDGLDICTMYRPTLTTIKQPYHELALQTVERLLQIANTPNFGADGKVYLRPELIVRESTMPFNRTSRRTKK